MDGDLVAGERYAVLNITYNNQQGELPEPVPYEATEADLRQWVEEAIAGGSVPGIAQDPDADLNGYVTERFPAGNGIDHNRIMFRPKTAFG